MRDGSVDAEFWYQRWRNGEIGFHTDDVNPLLVRYWDGLEVGPSARIFVPLSGKAKDMVWLAGHGHRVLGVELSPIAVEAFFAENGLDPRVRQRDGFEVWDAEDIRVFCGDFFALDEKLLGPIGGIYDRAALIALPPDLRARYCRHLLSLMPAGPAPMLLITLQYDATQMDGPPFPVPESEVRAAYGDCYDIDVEHHEDALDDNPNLRAKGLTRLEQRVYALRPREAV